MRTLVIFDSYVKTERIPLPSFEAKDTVFLFPLTSKSYITTAVGKRMANATDNLRTLQTAGIINSAAKRLRDKYIQFIAELPERIQYNGRNLKEFFAIDEFSTLWWFSLIAEKNIYKSDAFNTLAQLDSIIEVIKCAGIKKIIFGCGSRKLRIALQEYAYSNSIVFDLLPTNSIRGLKRRIRECQNILYLKHILSLLRFAVHFFLKTWQIKKKVSNLNREISKNDPLLLFTYYPSIDMSLAQRGIFKNKYYIHLQEALENERQYIIWIAMYGRTNSISLEESLDYAEKFIKNGYVIYFPEEFNSIGIQIRTLLTMLISGLKFLRLEKTISRMHAFDDYNFYPIFRDDWYSSFAGVVGYCGLMYYDMFKSLLSKLQARKCLYYCEMQAWEKALISARDAVRGTIPLLGYQHTSVSSMLMNYFNYPGEIIDERSYALRHPDNIVCNSRIVYNYMRESGWPKEKLLVAEAIRYNHLKQYMKTKWNKNKKTVLLVFSISPEESSSILNLAYESFKETADIEIWVKPHPLLEFEEVLRFSNISKESLPFQIKNGPIEDLLSEARIVIVGESSVSIEALTFGCEVVIVNVPEWINMSSLRYVRSELIRTVNSPEELRQTVSNIFNEEYRPEIHRTEASRIVNDYFYLNQDSDIPTKLLELLIT